jgi:subtilisin-like proprotein convertase family protein
MERRVNLAKTLATVLLLTVISAGAQNVCTYSNSVNQDIPDATTTGTSGQLLSTIEVSGVEGSISDLTVFLNISGGYNGDLYGYLQGENGGFTVLLNRVGKPDNLGFGYGDAGFNVTFSDMALAGDIHVYGGNGGDPLTGTWQPDGRNINPQEVLASDPRMAMLASFNNLNPNGTWTLFLADFANENVSTLVSWGFEFQAVPEPATIQFLAAFGGLAAAGAWWRRRNKF